MICLRDAEPLRLSGAGRGFVAGDEGFRVVGRHEQTVVQELRRQVSAILPDDGSEFRVQSERGELRPVLQRSEESQRLAASSQQPRSDTRARPERGAE